MPGPPGGFDARAGLCSVCARARVVANDRGSRFVLCRLAEVNPAFARYPVLPVRSCAGFEPRTEAVDPGAGAGE